MNILTIDNSYGDMPDSCVNEPIPHLLKAEKDAADEPAPLVWIYPMREYTTSNDEMLLKEMNLGDRFISSAINEGLPLCCVTSTDSFLNHSVDLYKKSSIVTPVPENETVLDKLICFGKNGIGILMYGTEEKLKSVDDFDNLIKISIEKEPCEMGNAWQNFGYSIKFIKKENALKPPTMAISSHNNALFFSVYNSDTTTDALFKFPQGAPILCGAETEIVDGYSSYRFSRGEHRECRIFAEQKSGVISCREDPPVNARFRRAIHIRGLKDATVSLFSEKGCECAVSVNKTDFSPIYDERFHCENDETYGTYLKGEHISGDIYFLIGHKETV